MLPSMSLLLLLPPMLVPVDLAVQLMLLALQKQGPLQQRQDPLQKSRQSHPLLLLLMPLLPLRHHSQVSLSLNLSRSVAVTASINLWKSACITMT
jgi:hypothetical protein